ncbi:DNA polymerase beta superfamily protein [Pedobacter sp.]|jgi:hypothetical protein|uniref:DNA polymerase beta superfamily protein n=1 Tax=Pedobacter sp. TaxID=1411316 RepID=UPI002BE35624|nr:nucleotidyltransferase domain-containing protein [Pedobacter sp.]HWW39703.1 nucleotidyltransferase domain-containing protein [Pedobacter sp.]
MTIKEIKNKGLLLFECVSGSRAYGLETPGSDTDLKGVYYLPRSEFYGLNYVPQVSNKSNDEVYYELGRYFELLSKCNPNILEMLSSPEDCVRYKHPLMEKLNPGMVLSKVCKDTFAGYAITQVRKAKGLKKKIVNPMPEKRASVLDFCFVIENGLSVRLEDWLKEKNYVQERCGLVNIPHSRGLYALFYDQEDEFHYSGVVNSDRSNDVSLSSVPKGQRIAGYLSFNVDSYSIYCKEYLEYWDWVENRNEDRYMGTLEHGKDYDAKNMMHTIRLLEVAEELLRTGTLKVRRDNRTELLAIRSGVFEYEELLKRAEDLVEKIGKAYAISTLPHGVDKVALENVLVEMRTELYKL